MVTHTTVASDELPPDLGGWVARVGWVAYAQGHRLPHPPVKHRGDRTRKVKVHGSGPCSTRYALMLGARAIAGKLGRLNLRPCPQRVTFRCPVSLLGGAMRDRITAGLALLDGRTLPVPSATTRKKITTVLLSEAARARLEALGGRRTHWIIQALIRSPNA